MEKKPMQSDKALKTTSISDILCMLSYPGLNIQETGPLEQLIQTLMRHKAQSLYPLKQSLVTLQINLVHTTETLRAHSGNLKEARKSLEALKKFKNFATKLMRKTQRQNTDFESYSQEIIQNSIQHTPQAVTTLIEDIETAQGKTLATDIKALLFENRKMTAHTEMHLLPLSFPALDALLRERGLKPTQDNHYGSMIETFIISNLQGVFNNTQTYSKKLSKACLKFDESIHTIINTQPQAPAPELPPEDDESSTGHISAVIDALNIQHTKIERLPKTEHQKTQDTDAIPDVRLSQAQQIAPGDPIPASSIGCGLGNAEISANAPDTDTSDSS